MARSRRHLDPVASDDFYRWVTVSFAARYASISTKTMYKRIREGRVPAKRVGGSFRIWLPDLDDAIVRGLLTLACAVLACMACHWRHRLGVSRLAV